MGLFDFLPFRKKDANFNKGIIAEAMTTSQFATGSGVAGNPLTDIESTSEFGGSRTTIPNMSGGGTGALPKKARRELGLDERQLASAEIDDLMDTFMDAHPDISFAIWNFLRLAVGDFSVKVYKIGSGKQEQDDAAEEALQILLQRFEIPNVERFESSRSLKKVLTQLTLSVITRGANAAELVLTPSNDDIAFIAPVDPRTIEFKYEQDRFVPYQDEGKISLDTPTFLYEALDEKIDNPYGRGPLIGAINMIMFQLQVLNDLKAVVHNQGYPRLDIKIVEEVLLKRMPIAIRNNEKAKSKWLNEKLGEIIGMYNNLEPDDTFVHFDSLEINTVGGGKGGGAMIDPEKLFGVIDSLIMAGLKTVSTILGRRTNGNTESFAKLEIKLYMKGVEAIQEVVERLMSRALTLALNIQGKQGLVEFKYKPIEIRTELEQAQFEQIHLQNVAYKRDQGWIDQDQASVLVTGAKAVAEPDWEHMGKTGSVVTNKDGAPTSGAKDEKTASDSSTK
ncbi:hypothetical protein [Peribacillus frigoritolerans]|uniref:Portal protein n=1 Tax=Peribacillus castrilensis TaxID=2897690 RepID=A0AAW9NHJ3_9BACI|nr:hypothetical protein [Peribacillus castrilensis]